MAEQEGAAAAAVVAPSAPDPPTGTDPTAVKPASPVPAVVSTDLPTVQPPPCGRKRQEDKYRKRDPRSWENIWKMMGSMNDAQKIGTLELKYKDLYEEFRKLSHMDQYLHRQMEVLRKEKDNFQIELGKSVVARSRVEELCRVMQKQNKQIKDENVAKLKEEEDRRKEASSKFANKLSDINTMMDENKEKSEKLREENLKMTAKLSELYNQFQKREEDISRMSHQLELERQYSQASLMKLEFEFKAEKELHIKEQEIMRSNLEKSESNCSVLLETVKGLQDHIDIYKTQYSDFESTMSKSAKVFDNFKSEISNMTKQVNTLEKESQGWKNKFHNSMKALVDMSELKKNQDNHIQSLTKKNDQLNKLCRQLQMDRSNYLKQLKSNGIEPTPSPAKEKPVEEEVKASPKMTKKEKELQTLKNNLKAMEDELSRIQETEPQACKTDEPSQGTQPEDVEGAKCLDTQSTEEKASEENAEPCVPTASHVETNKSLVEEIPLLESPPVKTNDDDAHGTQE